MGIFDIFKKKKAVCPWCGYSNSEPAAYCAGCGQAIPAVPASVMPAPPQTAPKPGYGNLVPPQAPGHTAPNQPYAHAPQPAPPLHAAGGFVSDDGNVPKAVYVPNAASGVVEPGYADDGWDGETTVLDAADDDEATVLEAARTPKAYLVREDTGEQIHILGTQFVLGRGRESANYCIDGKSVISRSHAAIIFEGGLYLVVDMNSSNKTYLDDVELAPGRGAELFSGSRIRLADLEFTFYIA